MGIRDVRAILRARSKSLVGQAVAIALVAATALIAVPNQSTAAPEPVSGGVEVAADTPYTPREGIAFNRLTGADSKVWAVQNKILYAIKASPRGSTIRMAQYLFDLDRFEKALIAAHKRGVNVQVINDDGEDAPQLRRLRKALGSNKARRSYVFKCRRGCMAGVRSTQHAKFYLFSQSGNARNVSIISSANPFGGNAWISWNDAETIVGNDDIYYSLNQYFDDMLRDKTNYNYYRTTTSGKYTLYFYPSSPAQIPQLAALRQVRCTGVAPGYGVNGRTVVRVAMWGWSRSRLDIAKQLWTLHNQGCNVYIILNKKRVGEPVLKQLLKKSTKYGRMRVYDAWYDRNNNNVAEKYMHLKAVTINGNLNGNPGVKVLYTGSQNFSEYGFVTNNELVLRVVDNAYVNAFNANLDYIRTKTKGKITRMPPHSYFKVINNGANQTVQAADGSRKPFLDWQLRDNGDIDFDR